MIRTSRPLLPLSSSRLVHTLFLLHAVPSNLGLPATVHPAGLAPAAACWLRRKPAAAGRDQLAARAMAAAALLAHLPVQLPPALEDAFQKLHAVHIKFQGVLSTEHNCIPHMAWEAQLAAAGGISYDQARFIVALFASVVLAGGIRLIRNPTCE